MSRLLKFAKTFSFESIVSGEAGATDDDISGKFRENKDVVDKLYTNLKSTLDEQNSLFRKLEAENKGLKQQLEQENRKRTEKDRSSRICSSECQYQREEYLKNIQCLKYENHMLQFDNQQLRDKVVMYESKMTNADNLHEALANEWKLDKDKYEKSFQVFREENNSLQTQCLQLQDEINSMKMKNIKRAHVMMYAAVNKELCDPLMTELSSLLNGQLQGEGMLVDIEKYLEPPTDCLLPLIVICINSSRLGTDVKLALSNINRNRNIAVTIVHNQELHALTKTPSETILQGEDYKNLTALVDVAYTKKKGLYSCDMNTTSLRRLCDFVRNYCVYN